MEIEIQRNSLMDEQFVIQEAASAGLQGMDHFIRLLNHHHHQQNQNQNQYSLNQIDYSEITDFTVAKFKKVISVLNRTGHARFRRAPVSSSSATSPESKSSPDPSPVEMMPVPMKAPANSLTIDFSKPNLMNINTNVKPNNNNTEVVSVSAKVSNTQSVSLSTTTASSSFMSSITGDFGGEGSVSNGKLGTFLFGAAPPAAAAVVQVVSSGKPPLASSNKKRFHDHDLSENVAGGGDDCHCSKRRKSLVKKAVRVPAISSKVSDIPTDECSWRKYGQKPIKGSPFPRGYYRCSSMRGCPAKKHVERDPNDPKMLIVTYEGEHRHSQLAAHGNIVIDAGCVDV